MLPCKILFESRSPIYFQSKLLLPRFSIIPCVGLKIHLEWGKMLKYCMWVNPDQSMVLNHQFAAYELWAVKSIINGTEPSDNFEQRKLNRWVKQGLYILGEGQQSLY